jgi:rSAM/selenodomain-associated transferase 1
MGHQVVRAVASSRFRTVVCFDPPEAAAALRSWLGDDLELRPQCPGDLGARLAEALEWAFETARKVVVIGTDAPDIDEALVERAFDALEAADVVLGPATDGGYYLLGLVRMEPELFREIPWSSDRVLDETLGVAHRTGMRVHLLETLSDVDTAADLQARAP